MCSEVSWVQPVFRARHCLIPPMVSSKCPAAAEASVWIDVLVPLTVGCARISRDAFPVCKVRGDDCISSTGEGRVQRTSDSPAHHDSMQGPRFVPFL